MGQALEPTARSSTRTTYDFIDGLRALAALAVAVLHAFLFTGLAGETTARFEWLGNVVLNGRFAVAIFIVLSGFVLMLPIARSPDLAIRDGAAGFFKRRARRILPPYYAALAFFTVLILAIPFFRDPAGTVWASKVPVTPDGFVAHLLLIHNLRGSWIYQIDGPMWSVATEVQIYLLMPFVLLPLWRRLGGPAVLVLSVVGGLAIHLVLPQLDGAHLWFVGLFAAGMLAAEASVRRLRWSLAGPVSLVVGVVLTIVLVMGQDRLAGEDWLSDVAIGMTFALGMFALATRSASTDRGRVIRLLETPSLVKLGSFSYSIYLFHSPVLGLSNLLLLDLDMPLGVRLALMWLVVTPFAVAVSYVAFLMVERRFLTHHQRQVAPV